MKLLFSLVVIACAAWSINAVALGGCGCTNVCSCAPEIKTLSSVCLGAAAVPSHVNWEETPPPAPTCGCAEPAWDHGVCGTCGDPCDAVAPCALPALPPCGPPNDKTYGHPINVAPPGSRLVIPSEPLVVKPVIVARTQSVVANPTIVTRPQSPSVQIRPVVLQVLRQIRRPPTSRTLVINRGPGLGGNAGLTGSASLGALSGLGDLAGIGGCGCGGPINPCGRPSCSLCC